MLFFITALSVILLHVSLVMADHVTCAASNVGNEPEHANFSVFCVANRHQIDEFHTRFLCNGHEGTKVADWGYLRSQVLEVGTPCNGGGFANQCDHAAWGVCLQQQQEGRVCLYLNLWNDCEWPKLFSTSTLPDSVTVWYK